MIKEFRGEYRFLSNFHFAPQTVYHDYFKMSLTYESNEHYFQAMKTVHYDQHAAIMSAATPGVAKSMGRKTLLRPDWNMIKLGVMTTGVEHKFRQHPELTRLLLKTHPMDIQEGNWWGDDYWGVCFKKGRGYNHLGNILKMLRDTLLAEHLEVI